LSEDKSGKHRWTDPVILVPIIGAVIAAIVGPIVVPIVQDYFSQSPETSTPTPFNPQTPQQPTSNPLSDLASRLIPSNEPEQPNLTVGTDKESYTIGEVVTISGNVSKPESGKSLRIDVYSPTDDILWFANGIKVYPNEKGFYTYDVNTKISTIRDMTPDGELIPGEYEVLVSYLNQSAKDTFDIE
jgi:hypothetical protein